MDFFNELVKIYPELGNDDFDQNIGTILLRDDGDGIQYIAKWEYSKPIPDGYKLGK